MGAIDSDTVTPRCCSVGFEQKEIRLITGVECQERSPHSD